MKTPFWEGSSECGWELLVPIFIPYACGEVHVGSHSTGVRVRNATVSYDDCRPSPKRFRSTAEAKAWAISTYILEEP